jgi:hypothetical protein
MLIAMAISVLMGLCVALCLGQILEPTQLRAVTRRVRLGQFTIRQMMAAVTVAGLLFHTMTYRGPGMPPSLMLLLLGLLIWFVRVWQGEFVFLMGLADAEFPGRHDKVIWAILLVAMAPIGVWFFRAYRLAHWPAPAPAAEAEADAATQPA